MNKFIFSFFIGILGCITSTTYADENMAEAVIEKAIEGGFSELEKQIIEKQHKSTQFRTYQSFHRKNRTETFFIVSRNEI